MDTFLHQVHETYLPAWFAPKEPALFLDYGITRSIYDSTGIPEPSLRLLLTILAGYPISILYRLVFLNKTSSIIGESARNTFFVTTGLLLSYYFNSYDIIHPLTTCIGTWLICKVVTLVAPMNRSLASTVSFLFNFGYLLTSYKYAATEDYDICYTMQQCVQCLRMIGYGMDFMDGQPKSQKKQQQQDEKKKAADQGPEVITATPAPGTPQPATPAPAAPAAAVVVRDKTPISFGRDIALGRMPTLAETIGYAFFPFAFLVGPQFSFSLYKKFISMDLFNVPVPATAGKDEAREAAAATANGIPQGSLRYATRCFFLGVFYLGLGQVLGGYFPSAALLGKAFLERPFLERVFIFWWTGKTVLNKYLGIWTIGEGPCVLSGITFNGYDAQGRPEWDGLRNVNPVKYEFATSLTQIVSSFNMNTNYWAKLYVFKRLRFLGNKNLSALGVLLFLAVWHGTHIGYFFCFGLEFMDMETERRLSARFGKPINAFIARQQGVSHAVFKAIWGVITWLFTTSALYFAAVPFDLLQMDKSLAAIRSINFLGIYVMLGLLGLDIVLSIVMPKKRSKSIKTE
ncbi:MBOAT, membrane-bound O-acyltransferase family-domain-containing protein [Gamsiella multidivaricata]|uniref:MBOAT, membrane-bound O-acyltransferase family-domain-containing protein n=1 Tax=Gamsiella multidivaricata TaxID=101098 RepID=UPI002221243D|nr:MBOAT, membrane-bound O-acyltransferase family-domain-containing protein [Gamsiella multidivaricata]KAG0350618.1 Lysophosphatidylcholine acyltransferase 3 [Gamsiella multidivaricata]KAI7820929.1 MBOAT, membrane-bound O-acyltransferase family-domain-containing protein [Gamsiella multidivaricata]